MTDHPPTLREPLLAFLLVTGLAAALVRVGNGTPWVADNLHGAIAIAFLYTPWLVSRWSQRRFDSIEAGLTVEPLGLNLAVCTGAMVVFWPIFLAAFFLFYGRACQRGVPTLVSYWTEAFAPQCAHWLGWRGADLRWPRRMPLLALSQLVVVAVPEEFFFRGYLWQRFNHRWPGSARLLGAPWQPLLATSLLFAAGHVLVDFRLERAAVFFPALVFGWMRARTGSVAAGALFHALCNLLSDVLYESFFR